MASHFLFLHCPESGKQKILDTVMRVVRRCMGSGSFGLLASRETADFMGR